MSDTQISVIGSAEPAVCTKMFRCLSEKLRAEFPATTCGYSMAKVIKLPTSMIFSWKFLNGKQAQEKVNKCSKNKRKGEKRNKAKENLKKKQKA